MLDPNGTLVADILAKFRTNSNVPWRWRVLKHHNSCSFMYFYVAHTSTISHSLLLRVISLF